ncbi:glucose uptake protein-like protein [Staphylococcus saccharolyticus]|uniref:Glucose uptake protein-like protein n=1 Tax=Staphylococcus saccharolyticus TaxID=33028 RepID=A0A380H298_9STAP|nr:glucose uptake protein-like protein [Staphylococcus saccharolyticus]
MPISTGMQLVGTTLFSNIFLGEWSTLTQVIMGLIAMILLVVDIGLTSLKAKNESTSDNPEFKKAMGILIISTVGYVGYLVLGDIFGVSGRDALFFQSIGMAIGRFILSMNHKTSIKSTTLNLIPGVI